MKKLALAVFTVFVAVFGLSSTALAAYPPTDVNVSVSNPTPPPGGTITVTMAGCRDGAIVTFVLENSTATAVSRGGAALAEITVPTAIVTSALGDSTASAEITVPIATGTYTGTATCEGVSATFTVTVTTPGGTIPATGASGISSTVAISAMLLLVGVGLVTASQIRRRQSAVA